MSDYVEAYTDDDRSTTTERSLAMDDKPDEQLTSTFEFQTDDDAQQLPSTMEMHMDSTGDYNTESDAAASIAGGSSSNEQVETLADGDYNDYYHRLYLAFVYAYGPNPNPRIVMLLLMRFFR